MQKVNKLPKEIKDKIIWLLILFPGILTFTIVDAIGILGEFSDFQIVAYSFALTLIILGLSVPVYALIRSLLNLKASGTNKNSNEDRSSYSVGLFFLIVYLISISLGLFGGSSVEKDTFYHSIQKFTLFGLIDRDSTKQPVDLVLYRNDRSLLHKKGYLSDNRFNNEAQDDAQQWIRIRMKDGKIFDGYHRHVDYRNDISQIYLSPSCEVQENPSLKIMPVKGAGIIIYEKNIEQIYLFDKQSTCRRYWVAKPFEREKDPVLSSLEFVDGT